MYTIFRNEDKRAIVGTVIEELNIDEDRQVARLRLEDRNGAKLDVSFTNSASSKNACFDWVTQANLQVGETITVLVYMDDDKSTSARGLNFMRRGLWNQKTTTGKDATIVMGPVVNPLPHDENTFRFAIPQNMKVNGQDTTRWINVYFNDGNELLAQEAKNRLVQQPGKKLNAVVRGGAITEYKTDYGPGYSITGYKLIEFYRDDAATGGEGEETTAEGSVA